MVGRTRARTLDVGAGCSADVDLLDERAWSEELHSFSDATIYQTWAYGSVRWGGERLSHLVVRKNNCVVGIAQVTIMGLPLVGASVAYVPWGPLWRKTPEVQGSENFQHTLRALKEVYVRGRGCSLRITPNIVADEGGRSASTLQSEGFVCTGEGYRTLMLDLSEPVEVLRKKLDQKWRNMLNRAERNKLSVVEGTEIGLYRTFLDLQRQMLLRKNFVPGVDYEEFMKIQERLPDSQKMRIMVCSCNDAPIAAVVVSALGDRGIYLLGATGSEGLTLNGSYLLQWRIVQWLKESGHRWYDLGGIDPDNNPGVFHFKAGLGGTESRSIGQFEYLKGPLSALCVRYAEFIRRKYWKRTRG